MGTFPHTPEDIDAGWLSDAVGAEITGFDMEQIGVGVGLIGRLYAIALQSADPSVPARLVAKFPGDDPVPRANVADPLRLYEREVNFYREFAELSPVSTPKVFAAEQATDSTDFVLLLEDLSHMRAADQNVGATAEEAAAVLDAIAAHHARFAQPGALDGHDWLPGIDDQVMQLVVGGMAQQSVGPFVDYMGDRLDARTRGFVEGLPSTLPAFMAAGPTESTMTLAHVDLRLDNVFFGGADRPVALIDWQIVAKAGVAYDVAYFLSQSLDVETRRQHEKHLVDRYVETLAGHGVRIDRDDFDLDYRRTVAFCAIYGVNAVAQLELANERAVELVDLLITRALAGIEDHDALDVWIDA